MPKNRMRSSKAHIIGIYVPMIPDGSLMGNTVQNSYKGGL